MGRGVVSFRVDNTVREASKENWSELFVVYNVSDKAAKILLPKGDWKILADKSQADCLKEVPYTEDGSCFAEAGSGMLLARK